MDFARKILNKYGWKEGEGLGKHSDGIVKPLKASMKFDNAGLGSDQAASDFNNHWWERIFNEAASNVEVRSDGNGVAMDLKNKEDSVEISTKGYSLKKLKKAKQTRSPHDARYENFLQSATLTKSGDEIDNPSKIAITDISITQYKTLSDEELFRACGGRTAHKGARHGLKLRGKLSRIEQQERELLEKMQAKIKSSSESLAKTDKKEKHKKVLVGAISEGDSNTNYEHSNDCNVKKGNEAENTLENTLRRKKNKKKVFEKVSIYADSIQPNKKNKVEEKTDNLASGANSVKKSKRKMDTLMEQTDTNVFSEVDSLQRKSKLKKTHISKVNPNERKKGKKER